MSSQVNVEFWNQHSAINMLQCITWFLWLGKAQKKTHGNLSNSWRNAKVWLMSPQPQPLQMESRLSFSTFQRLNSIQCYWNLHEPMVHPPCGGGPPSIPPALVSGPSKGLINRWRLLENVLCLKRWLYLESSANVLWYSHSFKNSWINALESIESLINFITQVPTQLFQSQIEKTLPTHTSWKALPPASQPSDCRNNPSRCYLENKNRKPLSCKYNHAKNLQGGTLRMQGNTILYMIPFHLHWLLHILDSHVFNVFLSRMLEKTVHI